VISANRLAVPPGRLPVDVAAGHQGLADVDRDRPVAFRVDSHREHAVLVELRADPGAADIQAGAVLLSLAHGAFRVR
jgi:hypothetical protein